MSDEKQHDVELAVSEETKENQNPKLVTWDGLNDSDNPKKWPKKKKWTMTLIVSSFSILSPFSCTTIAPAQNVISQELGITDPIVAEIALSIFILGMGFGPIILGPLSEVYGRYPILIAGNLFFLAWNMGCGFAATEVQLILCRLFTGLGSSAAIAISSGLSSDIWRPEERATVMAIANLGPLIGPALGPVAGGYITQNFSWRWILWGVTVLNIPILIIGVFCLEEAYAPKLLLAKAERLRKATGDHSLYTEHDELRQGLAKRLSTNLTRPVRMILTQSIIQVLCLYYTVLYGTMFIMIFMYPNLWTDVYLQSVSTGGLNYISMAVGFTFGAQIAGPLSDRIYARLKARSGGEHMAEYRTPLMIPGSLFATVGLLIYGWTGQYAVHWIVPNIGDVLFIAGCIVCSQSILTYTIDAYMRYAASAISTLNLVRSIAGFIFPLFAPYMYDRLGWGWSSTVLALLIGVVGLSTPCLLWNHGKQLRARSTYAAGA